MPIHRVGVVGAGLMGGGIAQCAAQSGFPTLVCEANEPALQKGLAQVHQFLEAGVARGKVPPYDLDRVRRHLRGTTRLEDLAGCDLVIEAIPEDLALKRALFERLDALCAKPAILATNTSSLSVTELSRSVGRGDRFVGLHFFNPVPLMKLVEVVHIDGTSPDALAGVQAWCMAIGKTVVNCGDSTGFIVNRLLVPFMLDAVRAFEKGLATRDDIDNAMRLGCGHPMGPLYLSDYVGLDTTVSICAIMQKAFGEERFAAPEILKRMVAQGHFGRKSGRGFYDWSTNPPS